MFIQVSAPALLVGNTVVSPFSVLHCICVTLTFLCTPSTLDRLHGENVISYPYEGTHMCILLGVATGTPYIVNYERHPSNSSAGAAAPRVYFLLNYLFSFLHTNGTSYTCINMSACMLRRMCSTYIYMDSITQCIKTISCYTCCDWMISETCHGILHTCGILYTYVRV